jgi:hypothetical protein
MELGRALGSARGRGAAVFGADESMASVMRVDSSAVRDNQGRAAHRHRDLIQLLGRRLPGQVSVSRRRGQDAARPQHPLPEALQRAGPRAQFVQLET